VDPVILFSIDLTKNNQNEYSVDSGRWFPLL
jgi:hypothetical protein